MYFKYLSQLTHSHIYLFQNNCIDIVRFDLDSNMLNKILLYEKKKLLKLLQLYAFSKVCDLRGILSELFHKKALSQ